MKICCIGREFGTNEVESLNLLGSWTLLDYDVAIIDFAKFDIEQIQGSAKALYAFQRRRQEILDFLALGRTVIAFVSEFPLDALLPIEGIKTISSTGQRVDFKGPDHLKQFWNTVGKWMTYLAYFDGVSGNPFLYVSETSKPIATWIKHDRGNLFLLPWFAWDENPNISAYRQKCAQFVQALTTLIAQIAPRKTEISLPVWSAQFNWQSEAKLRSELLSFQQQSDELFKLITAKSNKLAAEERLKVLFVGKGDALADLVIEVFRELGVNAQPGEPGRDDIIIEFEKQFSVVEVKGKKTSAAEADAAQLEKWVAGFKEEKGTDPKGILLVNAYCETPLHERTEPAFPHQMLKYSTQREHCLITTTQLLGLLLEARVHPEKRVDLVNSLFSTVGVFKQFSDWKMFLTGPAPAPTSAE